MKRRIHIAALLAICFTIGLIVPSMHHSQSVSHKLYDDEFYTDRGSWDSERLPLRKPYSLENIGSGWFLRNCNDTAILMDGIQEIAVVGDHLMGRAVPWEPGWTTLAKQCWFSFDLSKPNQTMPLQPTDPDISVSLDAFSNACLHIGITNIPELTPVKTFFVQYVEKGQCHWFPQTEKPTQ